VLDLAGRAVAAGVTTDEIDRIVHTEIVSVRYCHLLLLEDRPMLIALPSN
jgi:hypothetical protein